MNENRQSLYLFIFIACLGLFLIQGNKTDSSLDITQDEIMGHIRYLSHENRGGRYPGTRGSKDVISYIIKQFKSYGLKPGSNGSFIQPFDITTGIELGEGNYAVANGDTLIINKDYIWYTDDVSNIIYTDNIYDYCEKGLNASSIHPSGIFGPNDFKPSLFGQEFINIANGKRSYTVNIGYDYVDVRDLCTTAINCIEKGESKQNYIVGGNYIDFVGIG